MPDRGKGRLVRSVLPVLSVLAALFLIEASLRAGLLDRPDDPRPVWIPPRYREINARINARKDPVNEKNFFPFTDVARGQEKRPGFRRIVVLGDSFVWGDGLEIGDIWSRKLEEKVRREYRNLEVASWGIGGWSTSVEAWFLAAHGVAFRPDYLIVGFVTNDLDFETIERKEFTWDRTAAAGAVRRILPLTFDCLSRYVNRFLEVRVLREYGYEAWENRMYSEENLRFYGRLLADFSRFCRERRIPLLFVLTPQSCDPSIGKKFERVIPLLEEAGIPYLNLFPAARRKFGSYNPRKLWANPGNGHPGPLLTELFAEEVFASLRSGGVLARMSREGREAARSVGRNVRMAAVPSRGAAAPFFHLKRLDDRPAGPGPFRVGAGDPRAFLYLEGSALDPSSGGDAGGVRVEVDGRMWFPAYYGPTYTLVRPSILNNEFHAVPGSEHGFRIHIPVEEIGAGTHTLTFLVLSGDGQVGYRPEETVTIEVR